MGTRHPHQKETITMNQTNTCARCSAAFTAKRSTKRFCSVNCRTGAYHKRNRDEAKAALKRETKNTKRRTLRRLREIWLDAQGAIEGAITDLVMSREDGIDRHGMPMSVEIAEQKRDAAKAAKSNLRKYIAKEASKVGIDPDLILDD
jgi:hypothetical protein